jgi:oxygen-independent coproporphyrinogen-3 oxidase
MMPHTKLPENIYQQYMYNYPHKTAYRALEAALGDYFPKLKTTENTLYIHIPFCETKCGYCNLFTVASTKATDFEPYLDALERQARAYAPHLQGVQFKNLVLGGGTPLMLTAQQLTRVFNMIKEILGIDLQTINTVVETAPRQTTAEKLDVLRSFSVNRLSIGIESFIDNELKSIYRFHSEQESEAAIALILQRQFDVVNFDFIYGMPPQTPESLVYSLKKAVDYAAREIFVYPLYVKEQTGLHSRLDKDQPRRYALYQHAQAYLTQAGYVQKSMRFFIKKERDTALHTHCGFANTVALGAGARSYINELHFCDPFAVKQSACRKTIDDYTTRTDFLSVKNGFIVNEEEQKRIFVIKNILHCEGIDSNVYQHYFKNPLLHDFPQLHEWLAQAYAVNDGANYRLTPLGLSLSDHLGASLMSEHVKQRMASYWN